MAPIVHVTQKRSMPSILLVDDDPLVLDVMKAILEFRGFDVHPFTNPSEALSYFQTGEPKPEILVTDYHMADLDGLELIRRSTALSPALKTLLISGTVELEDLQSQPVQPDEFLSKPFSPQTLWEAVSRLCRDTKEVADPLP